MIRIKIVKSGSNYTVGDTVVVSRNEAYGLIDKGIGILTKDIVASDYKIKRRNSGNSIKLRPNKRS